MLNLWVLSALFLNILVVGGDSMNDFITAISWIVTSCFGGLWHLITTYWILAIFAFISILAFIADLVTSTREQ